MRGGDFESVSGIDVHQIGRDVVVVLVVLDLVGHFQNPAQNAVVRNYYPSTAALLS